jgi:signal transduction histidine kinase
MKCKDGSYKWLQNRGKLFTKDGEKKLIIISRDITDLKKKELKIKNQLTELEKLNELKSEYLRRATHELKIPLTSIKGYADLLLEINGNKLNPDIISNLENIQEGCSRLEHILKNIIENSKLKTSRIKLRKSRVNLSECIRYCLDELKELSDTRNHSIKLNIKEDLVFSFDKDQICEVLINILSNAMKYTPVNGNLFLKTDFKDNFVIVSISDNGIGITEEEMKKLFKEFGKVSHPDLNIDSGTEGSGLGLYISKQIIELHGGEIWVESEGRNKGSTFYFSLPLKRK